MNPRETIGWLARIRIKFRLSLHRQAYKVDGRHKFWGGMVLATVDGGKGLVAQHQAAARREGIHVQYLSPGTGLTLSVNGRVNGIIVNGKSVIRSKTVILCCGGFEASSQLRAQYLGPNWDCACAWISLQYRRRPRFCRARCECQIHRELLRLSLCLLGCKQSSTQRRSNADQSIHKVWLSG